MSRPQAVVMRVVVLALLAAAFFSFAPLGVPLALAAWVADRMWPLARRLRRGLRGNRRAAAAIVLLLAVVVLVPLVGLVIGLVASIGDLVAQVRTDIVGDGSLANALHTVVDGDKEPTTPALHDWTGLATKYSVDVLRAASTLVQASAWVGLSLFVFAIALYAIAAGREGVYA